MTKRKTPVDWQSAQQDRMIALINAHPGLDAIGLKAHGYHPATHGSLVVAERAGWLVYRNGWYLKGLPGDAERQRTTAEEQYAEYVKSFPVNDPRD